jgi:putative flavoprotein involved in K+ transport
MATIDASPLDVLVIGAGQAGLALGQQLKQTVLRVLIVDRHARVGDSWRERFDSLTLFTPRRYSALPGLEVPGDPEGYAGKDEIASYLETYARHFQLPLALGLAIQRLERHDGTFVAQTTSGERVIARAVVLATGAFQCPAIPALSQQLSTDVVQLSPDRYRNPMTTPGETVLVVGDGATGRQIARELATSHRVLLSTGHPRRFTPDRVLGKSIFWWMDHLGLLRVSRESRVGRYLMRTDPFPGTDLKLQRLQRSGVTVVGRVASARGRLVTFADGDEADIDAVVWATGYRDESDWVAIPEVKDARGAFVHQSGVSPVPGLYFIGRSWQSSRGSALLTGVGLDAATLSQQLVQALAVGRQPVVPEVPAAAPLAVS